MDFELSEEQAMLRDASRSMLADHCSPAQVRSLSGNAHDVDPQLWRLGCDLGWAGLAIPDSYGGAGQGLTELCVVAEELGRAVTPGPFMPTALVALAVQHGGDRDLRDRVLPGLADGSTPATWAFAEPKGSWTPGSVSATALSDGDSIILNGHKTAVQDAAMANWLLVTAVEDGEPTLFLVASPDEGITMRRQRVLDETRALYQVHLDDVRVPAGQRLDGGRQLLQWLCDAAAVLTSADSLGVGERLLEMTVEYVKARQQFGRAIGSFQAIKHKCSDMLSRTHGARASTHYAAMAIDAATADASSAASVAKSFTSEGMSRLAGEALQAHGGIGFTWEHDLHLYLRRAKTNEALYGDTPAHQKRLVSLLVSRRQQAN